MAWHKMAGHKKGSLEWITPQLLVGIIVVGILLVVAIAMGAKIYNSLFGGENERLMSIQFGTLTDRIKGMAQNSNDFVTDFMLMQEPDNGGYFIIGFDSNDKNGVPVRYFPPHDFTKLVAGTLKRPDDPKFCGDAIGDTLQACICLYDAAGIYDAEGKVTLASKNPVPLRCVIILSAADNPIIFSLRAQAYQKTPSRLVAWTDKSDTNAYFQKFKPYQDWRIHDPVNYGLGGDNPAKNGGYYKNFVLSHSDESPSKTLYLEKSTWFTPDGKSKATFIYVQEYSLTLTTTPFIPLSATFAGFDFSDTIREREYAFNLCPLPATDADKNACSYQHKGAIIKTFTDPAFVGPTLSQSGYAQCVSSTPQRCAIVPLKSCESVCTSATWAKPNVIDSDSPCVSWDANGRIEIFTDGTCIKADDPVKKTPFTHRLPCTAEITKECTCNNDPATAERFTKGFCTVPVTTSAITGTSAQDVAHYDEDGENGVLLPPVGK